jgi:hypothetical protein
LSKPKKPHGFSRSGVITGIIEREGQLTQREKTMQKKTMQEKTMRKLTRQEFIQDEWTQIARVMIPGVIGLLAYGYGYTPFWGVVAGLMLALVIRGVVQIEDEEQSVRNAYGVQTEDYGG